jgi:hypothetical protein
MLLVIKKVCTFAWSLVVRKLVWHCYLVITKVLGPGKCGHLFVNVTEGELSIEVGLELHSSIHQVFSVIHMWEQRVQLSFVLLSTLRKWFVESVVKKHTIKHAIVSDDWFLQRRHQVHQSSEPKHIF